MGWQRAESCRVSCATRQSAKSARARFVASDLRCGVTQELNVFLYATRSQTVGYGLRRTGDPPLSFRRNHENARLRLRVGCSRPKSGRGVARGSARRTRALDRPCRIEIRARRGSGGRPVDGSARRLEDTSRRTGMAHGSTDSRGSVTHGVSALCARSSHRRRGGRTPRSSRRDPSLRTCRGLSLHAQTCSS